MKYSDKVVQAAKAMTIRHFKESGDTIIEDVKQSPKSSWKKHEPDIIAYLIPRIQEWISGGMIPVGIAFNEGLEREVSKLCKAAIEKHSEQRQALDELAGQAQKLDMGY